MGKIQTFGFAPAPAVGTRVKYVSAPGGGEVSDLTNKAGTVVRLDEFEDRRRGIGFKADGMFSARVCESWELLDPNPLASLTDEEKMQVAALALNSAKAHGYCNETKKVLADLGLPTRVKAKRTVLVEIDVEEESGYVFRPELLSYNGGSVVAASNFREKK